MIKLDNAIATLRELEAKMDEFIMGILQEVSEVILDMNTEDQLFRHGINRNGEEVGEYAPMTVEIKQHSGLPFDYVTLYQEGDFHNSFVIAFSNDEFTITATDSKRDELVFNYGEEIFGLTDENFAELRDDYVKPAIAAKLKEIYESI